MRLSPRSFLLPLALFLLSATSSAQFRDSKCLSGPWTFEPLVPAGSPGSIDVPGWWSDHNPTWSAQNIQKAKYSRTFTWPHPVAGKRIKLRFGEVNHSCEVKIGSTTLTPKHYQGAVPFEYDVTGLILQNQQQTIEVTVWDHKDLTNNPANPLPTDLYEYPFGHPMWANKFNGIAQEVTLVSVPEEVYVRDIGVRTYVASSTIKLAVTVVNETGSTQILNIVNAADRITQTNPDPNLEQLEGNPFVFSGVATVPPHSEATAVVTASWPNPVLWWPHDPTLYRLKTELVRAGVTVDHYRDVRFGFRDFRIASPTTHYLLNDRPFHGWGNTVRMASLNMWDTDRDLMEQALRTEKAMGCRLIRHGAAMPPPPLFYDLCDEIGLMCIAEMNYNGQNEGGPPINGVQIYTHDYDNVAFPTWNFRRNVKEMVKALVRRDRNHPSIAIWSLENEVFLSSDADTVPDYSSYRFVIKDLETVVKGLDESRPIGCDSDGSLDGLLEIKNKHYPDTFANFNDNGYKHGLTNSHHNNDGSVPFSERTIYWLTTNSWSPTVPTGIGEFMLNSSPQSSPNSIFHPDNWGRLKANQIRGYRFARLSDIRPFTLSQEGLSLQWVGSSPGTYHSTRASNSLFRASMAPVAVFDHGYDASNAIESSPYANVPVFSEGSIVQRTLDVYNDDLQDPGTTVTLEWALRLYGIPTSSQGSQNVSVPLGGVAQVPISFTVPQVNASPAAGTPFILSLRTTKGAGTLALNHYVFKALDAGGSPVLGIQTFHDDFTRPYSTGFREHEPTWRRTGSAYAQESVRGLYPDNRNAAHPYGLNAKIAAIEGYVFDEFRATCDIQVVQALESNEYAQLAGLGFRLAHPDDAPWHTLDATRRQGFFAAIRKVGANWQLALLKAVPSFPYEQVVASAPLAYSENSTVRLEVRLDGNTIKARARVLPLLTEVNLEWTENPLTFGPGFVSLITMDQTAANFDNVAVGKGPFAPRIATIDGLGGGSVQISYVPSTFNVVNGQVNEGPFDYQITWVRAEGGTGTSPWSFHTTQTLTNLVSGSYTFTVRSRSWNPAWNQEYSASSPPESIQL